MSVRLYEARAGDGKRMKGMKRNNSYFSTPQDAVSEALALKEKMDSRYKNEIQWDYDGSMTGSKQQVKILRGYLGGNRDSQPFYLQINSLEPNLDLSPVSPKKPKKLSKNDKKMIERAIKLIF